MRISFLLLAFSIGMFSLAGCDASQQNTGGDVTVDEIAEYERLNDQAQAEAAADDAEAAQE